MFTGRSPPASQRPGHPIVHVVTRAASIAAFLAKEA